ncbi:MAG: hypothetical protein ACKVXR_01010 [Planctomycetota bacterium]
MLATLWIAFVGQAASPPWSGDGVVLADGRRMAGRVERLDAGRVRVTPDRGKSSVHEPGEISLIESGSTVELLGEERSVHDACWKALGRQHVEALTPLLERYLAASRADDCRRLMAEARRFGLDDAKLSALDQRVSKLRAPKNTRPDKRVEALLAAEGDLHEQSADRFEGTARWCAEHELWASSAAFLNAARSLAPARSIPPGDAPSLVPPGFPRRAESDALDRWLVLAESISPAGAAVLPPEDPLWARARGDVWKSGALALRTRHVVLFSREDSPVILGDCLGRAEGAVRALVAEIGDGAASEMHSPLVVLLHKERVDYLAEDPPGGHAAPSWSAGYYSPEGGVSRFYVPRENKEPLLRGLAEVLVHELTHHWISQVWLGTDAEPAHGDPYKPGFWIVEGLARFVEDQMLDMKDSKEGLSDPNARSILATADLAAQRRAFLCERLIDFSQADFAQLSDELLCVVQPGESAEKRALSERAAFYEQSGALVFFLANRAGPERREKLFDYARAWYEKRTDTEGWRALGYARPEELETAFAAFLAEARR